MLETSKKIVIRDRELNLLTLNRYRYSKQRRCKDLTDLIETLNGEPKELVRDLAHYISDEAWEMSAFKEF